ncbi:MAG: TIGR00282 family metallophosphoesterase [Candidatus Gastranaerophilales bacterium]|nr:TIGR00282 family metallophosphoesterase [Candidatus Gastranaerophilales bacterium]
MAQKIKILFLGDIVGKAGRLVVRDYLAALPQDGRPDFIIANVENASHGFGLTEKNYNELLSYGINCFTSGNHIWDKRDIFSYIDKADILVRPLNYPEGTKGVGSRIFEINNCKIGVINLLGRTFMTPMESPWTLIKPEMEKIKKETPIVFIDFHAEASAEKICFGKYCTEFGATAVVGTHTHVQTADETIINDCCAYITDAGFCGDAEGVIGMEYETSLKRLVTSLPERFEVAKSNVSQLNGVLITVDIESGCAQNIERINFKKSIDEVNDIMKG